MGVGGYTVQPVSIQGPVVDIVTQPPWIMDWVQPTVILFSHLLTITIPMINQSPVQGVN